MMLVVSKISIVARVRDKKPSDIGVSSFMNKATIVADKYIDTRVYRC